MNPALSNTTTLDAGPPFGRVLVREWRRDAETQGAARGTVLVLHGLGDHSGRHDWAASRLLRCGFRVVGFDWPGNGGSEGIRGDMPLVADAGVLIDAVLAAKGLAPSGIFAHSTGAFLVLPWLLRQTDRLFPLKWLWLSSPLLRPSHGQPALKVAFAKRLARHFPTMTLGNGVHARDCYHTGFGSHAEADFSRDGGHHRVSLRFALSLLAEEPGLLDLVPGLPSHLSYLLTQGLEDRICPPRYAEQLFHRLPGRRKTFLAATTSRHEPFREPEPEAFANAVLAWLIGQGLDGSD